MNFTFAITTYGARSLFHGLVDPDGAVYYAASSILHVLNLHTSPTIVGKILPSAPRYCEPNPNAWGTAPIVELERVLTIQEVQILLRHSQANPDTTQALSKAVTTTHNLITSIPDSARGWLKYVDLGFGDVEDLAGVLAGAA